MLKGNILFCGFLIGFCELIFEFILGGNLSSDSYRNFQKNHAKLDYWYFFEGFHFIPPLAILFRPFRV